MVLQQMAAAAPAEIRPKSADEALLDYWCSSLVLSAAFKFRVAPDNTYYLYRAEGEWQLSLISPEEWGRRLPGDYVAECQLSQDMTWKLRFDSDLSQSVRDALVMFLEGFQSRPPGRKALTSYCLTMWKVFRISSAYWPLRSSGHSNTHCVSLAITASDC